MRGFCVFLWEGIGVSRVPGVGDVYVWSSGIGSDMVMYGFMKAEQIRLVFVVLLNSVTGDWGVCCLAAAARIAVTLSPAGPQVRIESLGKAAATSG